MNWKITIAGALAAASLTACDCDSGGEGGSSLGTFVSSGFVLSIHEYESSYGGYDEVGACEPGPDTAGPSRAMPIEGWYARKGEAAVPGVSGEVSGGHITAFLPDSFYQLDCVFDEMDSDQLHCTLGPESETLDRAGNAMPIEDASTLF